MMGQVSAEAAARKEPDRLTSSDRVRRAEDQSHRREVETDTLKAVDEILSEVSEQDIQPRVHAHWGDGYILQRGRARPHLHHKARLDIEVVHQRTADAPTLDLLRLPRVRLRTE